jgi:Glycosyl transferase family 2
MRHVWRPLTQLGDELPLEGPTEPFSAPFLRGIRGSKIASLQEPVDFAVVMPTTLRPTIVDAVRSVFDQRFSGNVQTLIGIDASTDDLSRIEQICSSVPDRHSVFLFYPGYSTSRRHGGLHAARDGGSLRTILSYLANSRYISYLDDDNWWSDDHLSTMYAALSAGAEWAYARRWFVHPRSRQPICRDEWESVGPGMGYFRDGWTDPNCLAIDKIACEAILRWWSIPTANSSKAMDADRNVFRLLSTKFHGEPTGQYSVFYEITETDDMHPYRLTVIGEQRYRSCGGG